VTAIKQQSKRADRARETRRRIAAAARELFVEQGYGATSLQEVAERAGVAVQTIYFVFGNKRTLLKEVVDTTIAGDDEPIPVMHRPWFLEALDATRAEDQLRRHVHGTRQILDRVAPITKVVETAIATDPEVAALWPHGGDSRSTPLSPLTTWPPRYLGHLTAAQALVTKPGARAGVTAERAADLLYGLLSPALYLIFVRDRAWSPEEWEDWMYETLCSQLCATWRPWIR
jgi:AcrR family transcriptional regulator